MAEKVSLSASQQRAIGALLAAKSISAAAGEVGVAERTLYRWLSEPAFRQALTEAQSAVLTGALSAFTHELAASITALAIVRDTAQSEAARVSAARTLLELFLKFKGMEEFEQRLQRVEAEVERKLSHESK